MKTLSENDISVAYKLIENGDISQARVNLREIYGYDFKNKEVRFGIWCCSFWEERLLSSASLETFERAETLLLNWKDFLSEMRREYADNVFKRAVLSFKIGIFTLALNCFSELLGGAERNDKERAQIFRKAGLCHKKLGSFERALEFLGEANSLTPGDAAIIAERGDCFALVGDERTARILLKEAFFIDASEVDLDFLDSELIRSLIRSVEEKGYSGSVLNEWIPVYGVLHGVFNIKRPLRSQEVGRLRQDIYSLENDLKDPTSPSDLLIPRLINLYFWLVEHYVAEGDAAGKVGEILVKIRLQDEAIYRQFTK